MIKLKIGWITYISFEWGEIDVENCQFKFNAPFLKNGWKVKIIIKLVFGTISIGLY